MSAAGDDPARSARRVSVVSTIGYGAFLSGPPLLGFVGDHVGTLDSLLVVAVAMLPAAVLVGSVRTPSRSSAPR
jgi:cyanate permease